VSLKQLSKLWKAMGVLNVQGKEERITYNALKQGNSDKTERTPVISFDRSRVEDILGIRDECVVGMDEMGAQMLRGLLKGDVQEFTDTMLGYELYNDEVMDIAKGVFDWKAEFYEKRGIALEDIIEAIGEIRLQ